MAELEVKFPKAAINTKREIQSSVGNTVKMSSICDVHPICDQGVINHFGVPAFFEPVLSTYTSLTDLHYFPDQIFYNPWGSRALCDVYV